MTGTELCGGATRELAATFCPAGRASSYPGEAVLPRGAWGSCPGAGEYRTLQPLLLPGHRGQEQWRLTGLLRRRQGAVPRRRLWGRCRDGTLRQASSSGFPLGMRSLEHCCPRVEVPAANLLGHLASFYEHRISHQRSRLLQTKAESWACSCEDEAVLQSQTSGLRPFHP